MTIKEMSYGDLPVIITGNGLDYWDENEEERKGYILGANAVLREIEDIVYRRYSEDSDGTERNRDLINRIKHLKGI